VSQPAETILILEDDAGVARLERLRLERAGYAVEAVTTPATALDRLRSSGVNLIVLDNKLDGGEDGLSFYARLQADGFDVPVILVTGYQDDATIVRALRAGVRDYVFKSAAYLDYLPEAARRVLDQERTKRELRESQAFSRSILDSLGAHIAVLDRAGTIVATNPAWDRFGREHGGDPARCGVGANYLAVCERAAGPYGDEARAALAGLRGVLAGDRDEFALEYPCPWLAVPRWFALQATPLGPHRRGIVVSHQDITERKQAEDALRATTDELRSTTQQLWQAAKLAGVGELAASIAHELNNPLATVHLRVEGVLAKTPADDPRRRPLEIVDQEVERMAGLVGNLLHFIRPGRDQVSTVEVPVEVRKTIELTEPHLRRLRVAVEPEFHPDVPPILADRQQLRQVLLNLFTNAGDAMPHGGRLAARVRPGRLPPDRPAVVIEVADTGTGIPPEVLSRVFDPFFTTKAEGKGTGLGLAICKRIVDHHGGRLDIESEPGRGTTVRVALPVRNETNVAGLRGR
jgi:signal transduction histidine kinase/CheY-like chemotaxis protein